MKCSTIKEFMDLKFGDIFSCFEVNGNLAIETPFNFPDGDTIELYLTERNGRLVLSDLGETLRFLGSYDVDLKTYSKRERILHDVINSLNVKFMRNALYVPVASMERLPDAIFDLGQCMIRICDILYTVRGSSRADFVEEVKDYLDLNKVRFEEKYPVFTLRDTKYEFDLGVEVNDQIKLIELVKPPSKLSQKPNTDRLLRVWVDLDSYAPDFPKAARITLIDDTDYPWNKDDFLLLDRFSMVNRWTAKDKLMSDIKRDIAS
jgi:hypothetical protein